MHIFSTYNKEGSSKEEEKQEEGNLVSIVFWEPRETFSFKKRTVFSRKGRDLHSSTWGKG